MQSFPTETGYNSQIKFNLSVFTFELFILLKEGKVETFIDIFNRLSTPASMDESIFYENLLNARDLNKRTLLHWAAEKGHVEIVNCLVGRMKKNYRYLDDLDVNSQSPFEIALQYKHVEIARILASVIATGTKEGTSDLQEFLGMYISLKDLDAVKFLLDFLDTSIPPYALHTEIKQGNFDIVALLLNKGKGVDVNQVDENGHTPLQIAAQLKDHQLIKLLIDHGAKATKEMLPLEELKEAIIKGDLLTVNLLMEEINAFGIDDFLVDKMFTPFHFAVYKGQLNIVQYFVDVKHAALNTANVLELTPLHSAAAEGHLEIVKLLIEKGADLNVVDRRGRTPLRLAVLSNHYNVVQFLLEKGAPFSMADCEEAKKKTPGIYPLFDAKRLELIASVHNQYGNEPLHAAVRDGNVKVVKLLLALAIDIKDIEIKDEKGNTALHIAVKCGQVEIVKFLLAQGAKIDTLNKEGLTPFDVLGNYQAFNIELSSQYQQIKKLLVDHTFDLIKEEVTQTATTLFENKKFQDKFIDQVKKHLQQMSHPSTHAAYRVAYDEMSQSIINNTAAKLPRKEREPFIECAIAIKEANDLLKNEPKEDEPKASFEQKVIREAYREIKRKELETLTMQHAQELTQTQLEIVKKNIFEHPGWEYDKAQWSLEIHNAKDLIDEKQKLIQFLQKELERIKNDNFFLNCFLKDTGKTTKKTTAITNAIQDLEDSTRVSNLKQFDEFKQNLSKNTDVIQNRSRLFSSRKSDTEKHFDELNAPVKLNIQ